MKSLRCSQRQPHATSRCSPELRPGAKIVRETVYGTIHWRVSFSFKITHLARMRAGLFNVLYAAVPNGPFPILPNFSRAVPSISTTVAPSICLSKRSVRCGCEGIEYFFRVRTACNGRNSHLKSDSVESLQTCSVEQDTPQAGFSQSAQSPGRAATTSGDWVRKITN